MRVEKQFLIDIFRCIGCDTCSVACKMENGLPVGENRLRILNPQQRTVFDKPLGSYPELKMEWWPVMCQHCEDAPCIDDCPTWAIHQREDGLVEIDPELCIGCQNCGAACPYDAISFDSALGLFTDFALNLLNCRTKLSDSMLVLFSSLTSAVAKLAFKITKIV